MKNIDIQKLKEEVVPFIYDLKKIAWYYGYTVEDFEKLCKENPTIESTIKEAYASEEMEILKDLKVQSKSGVTKATMALHSYLNECSKDESEVAMPENQIIINGKILGGNNT